MIPRRPAIAVAMLALSSSPRARREVDHRVEADQVLDLDVPDVHLEGVDLSWLGTEGAGGEQVGVEPRDLMPGPL